MSAVPGTSLGPNNTWYQWWYSLPESYCSVPGYTAL